MACIYNLWLVVNACELIFDIPTKYQYLINIPTLIPIDMFFDTIVDVN